MANLKGSIEESIKVLGSTKSINKLKGSLKQIYILAGSVVEFTKSLSARVIIQPITNVYSKINMMRVARANIEPKVSVFAKMVGYKNTIVNITTQSNLSVRGSVFKNINVNINASPIFGKRTELGLLDDKTLDDMDAQTLDGLEFSEGVVVNVVKNTRMDILGVIKLDVIAYTLRRTKLQDIDSETLGTLDIKTLEEIEDIIN